MKFLCANCDEPMKLEGAADPDQGSISITFGCPSCGNRTTLLTNPGETQLVRALNVRIGGGPAAGEPMSFVAEALAQRREEAFSPAATAPRPDKGLPWTKDAEERLENVPPMARGLARCAIERYALEHSHDTITPEVMDRARETIGM